MNTRWWLVLGLVAGTGVLGDSVSAQTASAVPERAVRRDIPITNAIRRAYAASTRDSLGTPGPDYWQLRMDYTIHARLDTATSTVTGHETAVIHNTSDSPMTSIELRLDQNLFRANVPRMVEVPQITGGMQLHSLVFDGDTVNLAPPPMRRRRGGPPPTPILGAYNVETTSARVTLPNPIPAHGTGTLQADWSFKVPLVDQGRGERMGRWADSLYQVAQWYPRVAVYDDLRGWDTDPYLGPSEFYNNFGRFDVTLDVPAGWLVGATGVLQNPDQVLTPTARQRLSHVLESDSLRTIVGVDERGPGKATAAGDRLTWHFVADTVGDFAWAASSHYVWEATRATIPDRGPVPVNVFYVPGDARRFTDIGPTTRHALEFYSKLWMPYAFPQLTVADGPETGMEYPMFIMSAVGAADHETGHEWWPMMVGTNETWYGFMDEGFNQYMNILSDADRSGRAADLDGLGQAYGAMSGNEEEAPLMWDANYGGPMYSFQAYGKAPLMLSMLGGVVGDSAVWRAMSDYAKTWRSKHPTPWDYAFAMDHALGRDLGWFWYYWLFTTESVDGSIQNVKTDGGHTTVTVRQDGQMPSPVVLQVEFAPDGPPIRMMDNATKVDDHTVVVRWPASVWFSGSRTFQANLDFGPRQIVKITFDPHCRFPDHHPMDNIWPRSAAPQGAPENAYAGIFGGAGRCYGS